MVETLTLVANTEGSPGPISALPPMCAARRIEVADIEEVGRVYFAAYDPGIAADTEEEAVGDVNASLQGAYGEIWSNGTSLIVCEDKVMAAVITVIRAPWPDTPACPFVIELFVAREHRQRGVARWLLAACLASAAEDGHASLALRVSSANQSALGLHRSLGFGNWEPK